MTPATALEARPSPLPHPPEPSAEAGLHIPSLDGIRACSFLIVFTSHAGVQRFLPAQFGLTLFFVLSGYLITTLLRVEAERTGTVSLSQFYLRRVLRIFPPFYLILGTLAALTALGVLGSTLTPGALLAQACHLTNYYIIRRGWWEGMPPGTSVYWSLAVEEHFYLVFPLLFLLLRWRAGAGRRFAFVLLALCAAVLLWRFVLVLGMHVSRDRTYIATDTRIDSILFGCLLAVWRNPVLDSEGSGRWLLRVWLPLGAIAVAASLLVRGPVLEQTVRYTLQSAGLLPLFMAAIRWHDRGPFRLLNLRPIRYMGTLSYSLYLLHFGTLWALELHTHLPPWLRATIALPALILASSLIYRWVEKPCGRLRRKLSRYLTAPVARAA